MRKILFLLIFPILFLFTACGDNGNSSANLSLAEQIGNAGQNDGSTITTEFNVSGITCQRCASAIDRELSALNGVTNISINWRSGILVVEHEPEVSIEEIKNIVILEGFRIE